MGVRHRLPARNDGLSDIVGQWLRRHLPGQDRHHFRGDLRHQRLHDLAAIGIGRHHQRASRDLAVRRLHHPAIAATLISFRRRARIDAAAEIKHGARQPPRQRERIDVAAGPVPESAVPGIRPQHVPHLLARQQFDRRAEFRPLPHAALGDLDAAGRMHRLHPAGLLLLGLDPIAPRQIEQRRGAVAQHADKAFARRAMPGNDVLRIGPRQCRDHLAIVASGCSPSRLHRLDDRDVNAHFAQMQRRRQAGETAADDDDIGLLRADQFRQVRSGRRRHGP